MRQAKLLPLNFTAPHTKQPKNNPTRASNPMALHVYSQAKPPASRFIQQSPYQ